MSGSITRAGHYRERCRSRVRRTADRDHTGHQVARLSLQSAQGVELPRRTVRVRLAGEFIAAGPGFSTEARGLRGTTRTRHRLRTRPISRHPGQPFAPSIRVDHDAAMTGSRCTDPAGTYDSVSGARIAATQHRLVRGLIRRQPERHRYLSSGRPLPRVDRVVGGRTCDDEHRHA